MKQQHRKEEACAKTVLPHTVSVELELRLVNHPQSIKLIGQCTLAHHELGSVGSIKTVHTVGSQHTSLKQKRCTYWYCLCWIWIFFFHGSSQKMYALFPRKCLVWLANGCANFQSWLYLATIGKVPKMKNYSTTNKTFNWTK